MAYYEFNITIGGVGRTVEAAWADAIATLANEDGDAPCDEVTEEEFRKRPTEFFVKHEE
jgi:hypothetical protein